MHLNVMCIVIPQNFSIYRNYYHFINDIVSMNVFRFGCIGTPMSDREPVPMIFQYDWQTRYIGNILSRIRCRLALIRGFRQSKPRAFQEPFQVHTIHFKGINATLRNTIVFKTYCLLRRYFSLQTIKLNNQIIRAAYWAIENLVIRHWFINLHFAKIKNFAESFDFKLL